MRNKKKPYLAGEYAVSQSDPEQKIVPYTPDEKFAKHIVKVFAEVYYGPGTANDNPAKEAM